MCYSDFAAIFASRPLATGGWPFGGTNPVHLAPLPSFLSWIVAKIPTTVVGHVVLMQAVLTVALMILVLTTLSARHWRPMDASLLALTPLLPFTIFIAEDLIAVMFMAMSLLYWKRSHTLIAGVLAGCALASGGWAWILLLAFFVDAWRQEKVRTFIATAGVAIGVALIFSIPKILGGQSVLTMWDKNAGEGSPLFVLTNIANGPREGTNILVIFGVLCLAVAARWAIALPFDYRIETFLTVLIAIQLLTSPAIPPQALLHIVWLVVWIAPRRSFSIGWSIPAIVYVAAVWLRLESASENGKGIQSGLYGIISILLWATIAYASYVAVELMRVQGIDEVSKSYASAHVDADS